MESWARWLQVVGGVFEVLGLLAVVRGLWRTWKSNADGERFINWWWGRPKAVTGTMAAFAPNATAIITMSGIVGDVTENPQPSLEQQVVDLRDRVARLEASHAEEASRAIREEEQLAAAVSAANAQGLEVEERLRGHIRFVTKADVRDGALGVALAVLGAGLQLLGSCLS